MKKLTVLDKKLSNRNIVYYMTTEKSLFGFFWLQNHFEQQIPNGYD